MGYYNYCLKTLVPSRCRFDHKFLFCTFYNCGLVSNAFLSSDVVISLSTSFDIVRFEMNFCKVILYFKIKSIIVFSITFYDIHIFVVHCCII